MTREELKQRVDDIIAVGTGYRIVGKPGLYGCDDEAAHGQEDQLHIDLIKQYCPQWVIAEVERLSDANFGRFCA